MKYLHLVFTKIKIGSFLRRLKVHAFKILEMQELSPQYPGSCNNIRIIFSDSNARGIVQADFVLMILRALFVAD